jgi:hypothetical protein
VIVLPCISLTQPWAHLVCGVWPGLDQAPKDVENRCWNTHKRGTFLIHAAKGMRGADYWSAMLSASDAGIDLELMPKPRDVARGGIFGAANLLAVIPPGDSGRTWHMKPETTDKPQFGWLLGRRINLPFRPYKGKQGWFNVEITEQESDLLHAAGLLP